MHDDDNGNSFEDALRAMARDVMGSIERLGDVDLDELARSAGLDPDRARGWIDDAGQWLRIQVEHVETTSPSEDPWTAADPHPLDVPSAEQGVALAALDSGRWTIEPGTDMLVAHGDGPGPRDALGLVRELRVRDWLALDGRLTLAGQHALGRWLHGADRG
jgi:hypothetical protein